MVVADASVVIELLLSPDRAGGRALAGRIARGESVCAPSLLDAEVGQVIRRYTLRHQMSVERARIALADLAAAPIRRFPQLPLLQRAFELRENVTIYDGIYLALAETLDVPLLTCDYALASVPGSDAAVSVYRPGAAGSG